ncbi:hypothetical protein EJ04DRAFT_153610 [Polyplosphaeria fusca]|uniref:Uncharacterized protein n=1 Tax=Polyplosphaeria fusca TaxID=682080 RepID=A0A9P4V4V9_9PLEO|nr:hypothetical protein EJ04DRAFT_153610 [Polyplosphaeria fusca]
MPGGYGLSLVNGPTNARSLASSTAKDGAMVSSSSPFLLKQEPSQAEMTRQTNSLFRAIMPTRKGWGPASNVLTDEQQTTIVYQHRSTDKGTQKPHTKRPTRSSNKASQDCSWSAPRRAKGGHGSSPSLAARVPAATAPSSRYGDTLDAARHTPHGPSPLSLSPF